MQAQSITHVSQDDFKSSVRDKRVFLLYPRYQDRNIYLSYFLRDNIDRLLYYRVPEDASHLTEWLNGLLEEFGNVVDGFGSNLSEALPNSSPEKLAGALAADLAALPSLRDGYVLFLDELDRVPYDAAFRQFVVSLVDQLPASIQLVVNGRVLTYEPWITFARRGEAIVLGNGYYPNDRIFTPDDEDKPQVEVYAFGRGHVLVNGREINNWDGALPRNLFFYFMDNTLVTRDQIFDVFWPNLNIKEATNVFHVTKRKITERITDNVVTEGNYELTLYSGGFYVPSSKVVRHYDVAEFEQALDEALTSEDENEQARLYRRAIELYKGPFLQTVDLPWVEDRRERLRILYADALIGMGRIHKQRGEHEDALGYFVRALREMPAREDIHREVMTLYWKMDRPQDAAQQYRFLQQYLERTVGINPSRETRELHAMIQAG